MSTYGVYKKNTAESNTLLSCTDRELYANTSYIVHVVTGNNNSMVARSFTSDHHQKLYSHILPCTRNVDPHVHQALARSQPCHETFYNYPAWTNTGVRVRRASRLDHLIKPHKLLVRLRSVRIGCRRIPRTTQGHGSDVSGTLGVRRKDGR